MQAQTEAVRAPCAMMRLIRLIQISIPIALLGRYILKTRGLRMWLLVERLFDYLTLLFGKADQSLLKQHWLIAPYSGVCKQPEMPDTKLPCSTSSWMMSKKMSAVWNSGLLAGSIGSNRKQYAAVL